MKISEAVGYICRDCVFSCHKETCSRKDWCGVSFPSFGKMGIDSKCPLSGMEAVKPPARKDFFERNLTIDDTWQVCSACQHAKIENETISLSDSFEEHCIDCTCFQIRENLSEIEAEASIS